MSQMRAARVAPEKAVFRPVLPFVTLPGFTEKHMSEFWQKYKDPRWQRRRLEIMQRADFRCENCEDEGSTLNVHHKIYRKKADPWDYGDDELLCLCETCHEQWHDVRNRLNEAIAKMSGVDLEQVTGYAEALLLFQDHEAVEKITLHSYYDALGASDLVSAVRGGADEILDLSGTTRTLDARQINELYKIRRDRKPEAGR